MALALALGLKTETPPPRHSVPARLDPTTACLDDGLTTLLALMRPRDRKSTAEGTCDGEGRQGERKGEAWRPWNSAELATAVDGVDASLESMEAVDELLGAEEGDQGVEHPVLEDPLRHPRRSLPV